MNEYNENNEYQETIDNIYNSVGFDKKESFRVFLQKCINVSLDPHKSTYAVHDNMTFRIDEFFKGFTTFINAYGKDKKYKAGVDALSNICKELGIELEDSELFIFFHLRNLGKFRMKESTLKDELKPLWKQYPEYQMDDSDFSYALKNLMRNKFINYRRGNMYLNSSLIIRYRTGR